MALRSLVMTAALLSGFGAAQAADMPQRAPEPYRAPVVVAAPVYNWTGFYIGANGGYGWAGASLSMGGVSVDAGDLKGPFAGGQVGFNYQSGVFVFGVEADGQWANIKETYDVFGGTFTNTINYFFTVRGRLGVAADNFLFYGTGGYAHGGAKFEATDGINSLTVNESRSGWTAGGGMEIGFGNASVKFEYLYIQTFDKNFVFDGDTYTTKIHIHTAKIGLNYRFGGGPVVARY